MKQEAPSFQNMCLSLSSQKVYPKARVQVQVACLGYERNTSGEMKLEEKAAIKDYLLTPGTIGGEWRLIFHGKFQKLV